MNIAIIPARGGSKRIPGKNIRPFLGKPIIAYSIEVALQSGLFESVMVSTDDPQIADIAREYGASIPFMRPPELADDYTGTTAVVQHATQWFLQQDIAIENVCCLYATAPFVQARYLRQGLDKLQTLKDTMVFSVCRFPFPIQRAQKMDAQGFMTPFTPAYMASRSQDLEEAYHDAGQFYWWHAQTLLHGARHSAGIILPRHLVQDIDTQEDWQQAELMYQALQHNQLTTNS